MKIGDAVTFLCSVGDLAIETRVARIIDVDCTRTFAQIEDTRGLRWFIHAKHEDTGWIAGAHESNTEAALALRTAGTLQ